MVFVSDSKFMCLISVLGPWLSSSIILNCYLLITDLQLDVKGCRDVYASFDKYVEVERLEGDNKYHAEQYGLQVGWYLISQYMESS